MFREFVWQNFGAEELEAGVRKVEEAFRSFVQSKDKVNQRTLRRFRSVIESPTQQIPIEPSALAREISHAIGVSYGQVLDFHVQDFVDDQGRSGRLGQPEKEIDPEFTTAMLQAGTLAFQNKEAVERFLRKVGDGHFVLDRTPIVHVDQMSPALLVDRLNIAFTKYVDQIWFPAYLAQRPQQRSRLNRLSSI